MGQLKAWSVRQRAIALAILAVAAGCSTTRMTFVGPPGTVLFIDGKPYHLPATMDLSRSDSVGGHNRHDVSLVATVQARELRTKGYIDMFGYTVSDVDKVAVNTCVLQEGYLARVFDGTVVVFRGQSASRQPLYEMTLGK